MKFRLLVTPLVLAVIAGADARDPASLPADTLVDPASIAEAYWFVHGQPRDAWTFELDLRPSAEKW